MLRLFFLCIFPSLNYKTCFFKQFELEHPKSHTLNLSPPDNKIKLHLFNPPSPTFWFKGIFKNCKGVVNVKLLAKCKAMNWRMRY